MKQFDSSAQDPATAVDPPVVQTPVGGPSAADPVIVSLPVGADPAEGLVAAATVTGADELAEPLADSLAERRLDTFAQVLHDEPLQLVIAAMLHLDGLPPQYRSPSLQSAVDLLERAAKHLRQLVQAMSLPDPNDPLTAAVRRAIDALMGGRDVRLECTGEAQVPLSRTADQAARAILFSALSDTRTRASVSTVVLDQRTVGSDVVITLDDDGGDRLQATPRPGPPSLADLRAEAAAVGGTLDAGPGSVVTLTLPREAHHTDPTT